MTPAHRIVVLSALRLLPFAFLTAGFLLPGAAGAQANCGPPKDDERLASYLARYSACLEAEEAESSGTSQAALPEAIEAGVHELTTSSATPGFGSRVRDSIEDFLPLLGISADAVSVADDDKSISLRLNPLRGIGFGALGLTVTAKEAEPGAELLKVLDAGQVPAFRELVKEELGDFDDLTFGTKIGIEPRKAVDGKWTLGRSYERYRGFIENSLLGAFEPVTSESSALVESGVQDCDQAASVGDEEPVALELATIRQRLRERFDECLDLWRLQRAGVVRDDRLFDVLQYVPHLIDNQPQLVFAAEVHDRQPLVGRDGWSVKVSFEKGFNNFNSLLERYRSARESESADSVQLATLDALRSVERDQAQAGNKLTFSIAYAERAAYTFDQTFGEGDDAIAVAIDLPKADELSWKVAYTRNATWHPIDRDGVPVFPRLSLSLDFIDVSDDPKRRDRMVGIATYEIPLGSGSSLPLSLTYANHSEFLGEPDEELSAHFGFSYKVAGGGRKTPK